MSSRLIFGTHPVLEALAARRRDIAVVLTSESIIEQQARRAQVPCERRSRPELDQIAGPGARHQGAIALVGEYPYATIDEVLAGAVPALVLALDSVTDPQNLGALVRSAHVLGAGGVIVPRDRAAQVTPAVVRASAGATEHTRIASVVNLTRTLEELKERGLWIVGAVLAEGARAPWEVDLREPVVLVVGAESTGLRRLVQRVCDFAVRVPMTARGVGSLNAAAAGAVLLYEAVRQRRQP